jgi:hypothetical protein
VHLSLHVPHPLAQLARILTALEEARHLAPPETVDREASRARYLPPEVPRVDLLADLECMALLRLDSPPEQTTDAWSFLSLSRAEESSPDARDELSDLSLSRPIRRRPDA